MNATITLYVYENALLGDNGTNFNDASLVDEISGFNNEDEALHAFEELYGSNDYSASFTPHD